MTTADNWTGDVGGDWATATWSLGQLPSSSDTVTISTADVQYVTHNSGADIVDKLSVGVDYFTMGGGSLDILTTASFADGLTQTGGVLQAGAVAVTGPLALLGGVAEGATAFTATGTTTLFNYILGGSSTLAVSATANQTGQITIGDDTGVGAAINIAKGGVYDIGGDFSVYDGQAEGSAGITNAGTLAKKSGSGVSAIAVGLVSTGTLSAASGDLEISGANNTVDGTVSGAGEVAFSGGVTALGATSVTVATLGINNALGPTTTVDLTANLTYLHTFLDESAGQTTLNLGGFTLSLGGITSTIVGAGNPDLLTGSGAFYNKTVLTLGFATFGGTLKVTNDKTINQTGETTFGDGAGGAPTVGNASSGVWDFTTDNAYLLQNGATVSFANQGLLEKTGTGGVSGVGMAVTNSGTISAQSGVIDFTNSLTNTGTIGGAATVEIGAAQIPSAVATLGAGTVLSVGTLELSGTSTLNLGASLSYAGVFSDVSYLTDYLNLEGNTLTLTGGDNTIEGVSGVADITGSAAGKLVNSGTLTLAQAVVDGAAELDNTGTINQTFNITIGGAAGLTASIVNAAGAHYTLVGPYIISNGVSTASHFDNAGTVTVQNGGGVGLLDTVFNNQSGGVLNIATGTLQNDDVIVNAGTISGTKLQSVSGDLMLDAGSKLTLGEFDLLGSGSLTMAASLTYTGTFVDAASNTTTINLGAAVLALKGPDIEFNAAGGTDLITGSGALKLEAASYIEGVGGATTIGGTAQLEIMAATTATGSLTVGDGSAHAAGVVVETNGSYDLTADVGVAHNGSAASTFTNDGLFEKTAGSGVSLVSASFINNGTITVTSGTLEFLIGTLVNHGTINGVETTDTNGDILITAAAQPAAVRKTSAVSNATTAATARLLAQSLSGMALDSGAATAFAGDATRARPALLGLAVSRA